MAGKSWKPWQTQYWWREKQDDVKNTVHNAKWPEAVTTRNTWKLWQLWGEEKSVNAVRLIPEYATPFQPSDWLLLLDVMRYKSYLIALGMMHTWTGEQRFITPSTRLSLELLICLTPRESTSEELAAAEPSFKTPSSSTSGVYLRTKDTSIKPGSANRKGND